MFYTSHPLIYLKKPLNLWFIRFFLRVSFISGSLNPLFKLEIAAITQFVFDIIFFNYASQHFRSSLGSAKRVEFLIIWFAGGPLKGWYCLIGRKGYLSAILPYWGPNRGSAVRRLWKSCFFTSSFPVRPVRSIMSPQMCNIKLLQLLYLLRSFKNSVSEPRVPWKWSVSVIFMLNTMLWIFSNF